MSSVKQCDGKGEGKEEERYRNSRNGSRVSCLIQQSFAWRIIREETSYELKDTP